jgi:hypothetical protein
MENKCEKLGIPTYLHKNNRSTDQEFNSEIIYRRFYTSGKPEDWKNDRSISASIFPVKDDSCNRDKYSKEPQDVLYNTREQDKGLHYTKMGVLSFCSSIINGFSESINQNDSSRDFTLKLVHDPLDCMYPHCEIVVLEGDVIINQNKPKSIKTLIRDILIENITIVVEPNLHTT